MSGLVFGVMSLQQLLKAGASRHAVTSLLDMGMRACSVPRTASPPDGTLPCGARDVRLSTLLWAPSCMTSMWRDLFAFRFKSLHFYNGPQSLDKMPFRTLHMS